MRSEEHTSHAFQEKKLRKHGWLLCGEVEVDEKTKEKWSTSKSPTGKLTFLKD